jgi:hypothetical protein
VIIGIAGPRRVTQQGPGGVNWLDNHPRASSGSISGVGAPTPPAPSRPDHDNLPVQAVLPDDGLSTPPRPSVNLPTDGYPGRRTMHKSYNTVELLEDSDEEIDPHVNGEHTIQVPLHEHEEDSDEDPEGVHTSDPASDTSGHASDTSGPASDTSDHASDTSDPASDTSDPASDTSDSASPNHPPQAGIPGAGAPGAPGPLAPARPAHHSPSPSPTSLHDGPPDTPPRYHSVINLPTDNGPIGMDDYSDDFLEQLLAWEVHQEN